MVTNSIERVVSHAHTASVAGGARTQGFAAGRRDLPGTAVARFDPSARKRAVVQVVIRLGIVTLGYGAVLSLTLIS